MKWRRNRSAPHRGRGRRQARGCGSEGHTFFSFFAFSFAFSLLGSTADFYCLAQPRTFTAVVLQLYMYY